MDPLHNQTVLERLNHVLANSGTQSRIRKGDSRIVAILRQCARYLDAWNEEIHLRPNLDDYEVFGLVRSIRPTSKPENRTVPRGQLLRIAATAKVLDAILEAELFFATRSQSLGDAKIKATQYLTSRDILIARTNLAVYQSSDVLVDKSAAKVCRSILRWRTQFAEALKDSSQSPKPRVIPYPVFSDVPNGLLADIFAKDARKDRLVAEVNVKRACFALLTLWGLLNVCDYHPCLIYRVC